MTTRSIKMACGFADCLAIHHYTPIAGKCKRCGRDWRPIPPPLGNQQPQDVLSLETTPAPEPKPKPDFGNNEAKQVKKLFPGSHKCLPGQLDLFPE